MECLVVLLVFTQIGQWICICAHYAHDDRQVLWSSSMLKSCYVSTMVNAIMVIEDASFDLWNVMVAL